MIPLSNEAVCHTEAASGWLELGNLTEAMSELDNIAPLQRAHPSVLDIRWRIYAKAGRWDIAEELVRVVLEAPPKQKADTLYSLAVYAWRAKRSTQARQWLQEALAIGGKELKLRALDDPELQGLWTFSTEG